MSDLMARVLTGCNATSYVISSAMAYWMIDRFGRRSLMMGGAVLQCFAYIMVAISIALLATAPSQWGAVAITFLFFYYAAFGCTWGMVPWVYQSEINSLAMRAKGSAAATSFNWLFGFVCTQFTPTAIENIGYRFYISEFSYLPLYIHQQANPMIVFASFNLIFIPIVYFFYPETANRTLEDLNAYFDRDSGNSTFIAIGNKAAKQKERPVAMIEAERQRIEASAAKDESQAIKAAVVHTEEVGNY
jgi:MFS family permease